MKQQTKTKLRVFWEKTKGALIPIGIGSGIGMIIGGYFGAIFNAKSIEQLEQRTDMIENVVNHNADAQANNLKIQIEDHDKLEELIRQNNLLMEKALQETKGETAA